jgi:hypothetical protein
VLNERKIGAMVVSLYLSVIFMLSDNVRDIGDYDAMRPVNSSIVSPESPASTSHAEQMRSTLTFVVPIVSLQHTTQTSGRRYLVAFYSFSVLSLSSGRR